jgi:Type II secretion system (T2SS), protein M
MMTAMRERFARLAPRERMILTVGGLTAVGLLVWALAVDPAFTAAREANLAAERKEAASGELAQILADYERQNARIGAAAAQGAAAKDFSLLSFLEGLSAQAQVKGNIDSMRPTTSDMPGGIREYSVEIKLTNIRLQPMVTLISAVERSPYALRVKRLHVKRRFADPDLLDVTFTVARYEEA